MYNLKTTWRLDAPRQPIWDALIAADEWPVWWRYVKNVELLHSGEVSSLSSTRRFTWTSKLPYRLCFEVSIRALDENNWIEADVSGDLKGTGKWVLSDFENSTLVTYFWTVSTEKAWMNLLAPVLSPIFVWNHHQVMDEGAKGLARYLGVALLEFERSGALPKHDLKNSSYNNK